MKDNIGAIHQSICLVEGQMKVFTSEKNKALHASILSADVLTEMRRIREKFK